MRTRRMPCYPPWFRSIMINMMADYLSFSSRAENRLHHWCFPKKFQKELNINSEEMFLTNNWKHVQNCRQNTWKLFMNGLSLKLFLTLFGEGPSLGQGVTFTGLYLGQIAYLKWVGAQNGKRPNRDIQKFSNITK